MSEVIGWVERHSTAAPPALRARALAYVARAGAGPAQTMLAQAAHEALRAVEQHPGDRSAALDLLAADALITLALLAQAETAPEQLAQLAGSLLDEALPAA